MRNEIHLALIKHLHELRQEHGQNKAKLHELYGKYESATIETLQALSSFADLLYLHGVNEDGESNQIPPELFISAGVILRNNLDMLNFNLYGKEQIGNYLYALAEGKNNG